MGVPPNSVTVVAVPHGGRARKYAIATSTPRVFRARMILIGSIAVPSNSPGIGNEVTINTRIQDSIRGEQDRNSDSARYRILRRRVDHAHRLTAMSLIARQCTSHATVKSLD